MNCQKCKTPHNKYAKFCKNCGIPINVQSESLKVDQRDFKLISIIFMAGIFQYILTITFSIVKRHFPYNIENTYGLSKILAIINIIIVIIIASAIRNKNMKIVLYIYAIVSLLFMAYYYFTFPSF